MKGLMKIKTVAGAEANIIPEILMPFSFNAEQQKYVGGWHLFKGAGMRVEAGLSFIPYNLLSNDQALDIGMVMHYVGGSGSILILSSYPLMDKILFSIDSSGVLKALIDDDTVSINGTSTEGSVSSGDILLFEMKVQKASNNIYIQYGAAKYDWDNDTYETIVKAYAQPNYSENIRMLVLAYNFSEVRIAIPYMFPSTGIVPSDGIDPTKTLAILRLYRSMGLQDPRTISW